MPDDGSRTETPVSVPAQSGMKENMEIHETLHEEFLTNNQDDDFITKVLNKVFMEGTEKKFLEGINAKGGSCIGEHAVPATASSIMWAFRTFWLS